MRKVQIAAGFLLVLLLASGYFGAAPGYSAVPVGDEEVAGLFGGQCPGFSDGVCKGCEDGCVWTYGVLSGGLGNYIVTAKTGCHTDKSDYTTCGYVYGDFVPCDIARAQ